MEMLIYILNVGAVLCMSVTTFETDVLSAMNEMALKDLMCQNYHMLFAKCSHNIIQLLLQNVLLYSMIHTK